MRPHPRAQRGIAQSRVRQAVSPTGQKWLATPRWQAVRFTLVWWQINSAGMRAFRTVQASDVVGCNAYKPQRSACNTRGTLHNAQRAMRADLMRMPCMFLISSVSTSWTSACWSVWQIHQHHWNSPEYPHDLTCANTGRARVKPRTAAPRCSQRFIDMSKARPSAKVWHELNAQMWRVPAETPDL